MPEVTPESIKAFFENEAKNDRRLIPDSNYVSGLGSTIKYEKATNLMANPEISKVLDVGCNRGSVECMFHSLYPDKARTTYIDGLDVSEEAIRQANDLELPNCTFRNYDGNKFPYPSESFDLIISVEVIEHVIEKEKCLNEMWRVLRPSGKLYLTTPNPECLSLVINKAIWTTLRRLFQKPQLEKDTFITLQELSTMLTLSGFYPLSKGSMYFWPRIFIYFNGWSLFPPLPPRVLYYYQKLCMLWLDNRCIPEWLDKRINWSLVGIYQKKDNLVERKN